MTCILQKKLFKIFVLYENHSIMFCYILFYFSIYVVVVGRDKNKGINIDDLYYVLSPLVKR